MQFQELSLTDLYRAQTFSALQYACIFIGHIQNSGSFPSPNPKCKMGQHDHKWSGISSHVTVRSIIALPSSAQIQPRKVHFLECHSGFTSPNSEVQSCNPAKGQRMICADLLPLPSAQCAPINNPTLGECAFWTTYWIYTVKSAILTNILCWAVVSLSVSTYVRIVKELCSCYDHALVP